VRRMERLPVATDDDLGLPELQFLLATDLAVLDHSDGSILLIANVIRRLTPYAEEDPDRVVATSFAAVFWGATAGALVLLPFAGPISEALLDHSAPGLARIAIGGLWVLTLFEYLLTLFRLEERARAYFVTTIANVLVTIPVTLVLVVGADEGARGLLLGSYLPGAAFVLALIVGNRINPQRPHALDAVALYWHFVDVVWVFVLSAVYLLPLLR